MAESLVMVVTPAISFEISAYVAEMIQNITESIVITISDTVAAVATRSAVGQSESYTVAAGALGSGVDDGHGIDDEMTSQATTSDDVSILAASAVTLGLALAVGSFAAMWATDNPIPSLLFAAGLFLATYGFWLINRAARRRTARAH